MLLQILRVGLQVAKSGYKVVNFRVANKHVIKKQYSSNQSLIAAAQTFPICHRQPFCTVLKTASEVYYDNQVIDQENETMPL